VLGLTWGTFPPAVLDLPPVDVLLGADCFYHEGDFNAILATVAFFVGRRPGCRWVTGAGLGQRSLV
jgi:methyltransferase-like protein 23